MVLKMLAIHIPKNELKSMPQTKTVSTCVLTLNIDSF
jgi:hypothetical protein